MLFSLVAYKQSTFIVTPHFWDQVFAPIPLTIWADLYYEDVFFKDEIEKYYWLDRLASLGQTYARQIRSIEFRKEAQNKEVLIYLKNGDLYYFSDGRLLPRAEQHKSKAYLSFYDHYFLFDPQKNYSYGNKNYSFFYSLYGKNRRQIEKNLVPVRVFKHTVRFNKKNNAALQLQKCIQQIEKEAAADKTLQKWIDSLGYVGAYAPRKVASANKISLHSFAIAIDFIPRVYDKQMYWFWSIRHYPNWWEIGDHQKIEVPQKFIQIFEKNGFCWGGRWVDYDLMHFEYRPEIINLKIR